MIIFNYHNSNAEYMSIKISQINQKQNINFRANAKTYSNIVSKVDSLSNSNRFKQNYQFVEKILEASQQIVFPQNFTFEKNQFILYKNVFPTSVFKGYEVYVNNLPLKGNQSMLDMGCGCGVIGITALKKYKLNNVVCADINGIAVKNTRRNVHLNNLDNQVTVVQSNLFSNIDKNQRFDLIFWNPPYFDGEKKNGSILYKSMYDKDYKNIKKFIIEGQAYLNKNGKIMLGFSSSKFPLEWARSLIKEIGYDIEIYHQETDVYGNTQEVLNIIKTI